MDAGDSRYYLTHEVTPESWDQWNIDRDHALAAMAAEQTPVNGADPNGAGWSDLDHYGDWYSVPNYGSVWAPRGVDVSWDPYGSGSWAYYPGVGYVWVSANPWGWLPYHCGNWAFFDGFGWAWVPGDCNAQWFTDVEFWNAPSYYVRPQKPRPVGPHDNLPRHNPIIIVRRGGGGIPIGSPRGGQLGVLASGSPRTLVVGGQQIAPLPKMLAVSGSGQRAVGLAGPTSPAYALPQSARELHTFGQSGGQVGDDRVSAKAAEDKDAPDTATGSSTAAASQAVTASATSSGTVATVSSQDDADNAWLLACAGAFGACGRPAKRSFVVGRPFFRGRLFGGVVAL
jgi:hypothetical protein